MRWINKGSYLRRPGKDRIVVIMSEGMLKALMEDRISGEGYGIEKSLWTRSRVNEQIVRRRGK
jgi:hypothetical protein